MKYQVSSDVYGVHTYSVSVLHSLLRTLPLLHVCLIRATQEHRSIRFQHNRPHHLSAVDDTNEKHDRDHEIISHQSRQPIYFPSFGYVECVDARVVSLACCVRVRVLGETN